MCRAAPSSIKEYREVYAGEAHTGEVQCFKVVYDSSRDMKEVNAPVSCDSPEAFFKGSSYTGFMGDIKEMYLDIFEMTFSASSMRKLSGRHEGVFL